MFDSPYAVKVEKGKVYAWCTCGLSQKQPLCDGSHRDQGGQRSLKWTAPRTGTMYFCGCKKTQKPPLCDGSHNKI